MHKASAGSVHGAPSETPRTLFLPAHVQHSVVVDVVVGQRGHVRELLVVLLRGDHSVSGGGPGTRAGPVDLTYRLRVLPELDLLGREVEERGQLLLHAQERVVQLHVHEDRLVAALHAHVRRHGHDVLRSLDIATL